jgi:membrane protein implicated in regulation of membrane protease activity
MPSKLARWICKALGLVPLLAVVFGPYHAAANGMSHGMAWAGAMSVLPVSGTGMVAVFIVAFSLILLLVGPPMVQQWRDERAARSKLKIATCGTEIARQERQIAKYEAEKRYWQSIWRRDKNDPD